MKRLILWTERNREKLWFCVGLNLLVLAVLVLLMRPSFETDDDIAVRQFVNGARGSRDAHLVYQNYLLGLLYGGFYSLAKALPWYMILQYFFLFAAFTAVTWVLLHRLKGSLGIVASLVVLFSFGYECYIKIQYTKTAGILSASGMFLLFYFVTDKDTAEKRTICRENSGDALRVFRKFRHFPEMAAGIFLCCLGAMYRMEQFFPCAALMTGIGLFLLLELRRETKRSIRRKLLLYLGTFGGMLLLILLLFCGDRWVYEREESWQSYMEFNAARTELLDYGFPDYETNQSVYQELDMNEAAYKLYKGWSFNDPDKFTVSAMRKLEEAKPDRVFNRETVFSFLKTFAGKFFQRRIFYVMLLFLLLWLAVGNHRITVWLSLFYEGVLFGGLYLYLFYIGRFLYNRVDVGLSFAVCLVLAWFLSGKKRRFSGVLCWVLFLALVLVNQKAWQKNLWSNSEKFLEERKQERERMEKIGSDKEHLYLIKMGILNTGKSYGPFDRMPEGLLSNLSWLGGWTANTESCREVLKNYGVENPYRDMIGNEQVYLIDYDIETTMAYLHAYYQEDARATVVGKYGKYNIYQIE